MHDESTDHLETRLPCSSVEAWSPDGISVEGAPLVTLVYPVVQIVSSALGLTPSALGTGGRELDASA